MRKLIFLACLAVSLMVNAQVPKNDLIAVSHGDTTGTYNTTAIYLDLPNCNYSAAASFQIKIARLSGTTAGYAVMQYSVDGSQWISGVASGDSVALLNSSADTCVVLTYTKLYGKYHRIKIACSGTHTSRYGVAWCYKLPLMANYNNAIANIPGNKPSWISDILAIKNNFYTDSLALSNTTSHLFSINTVGLYDGMLTAHVYSDTSGTQTYAGYAYLQGSNNNVNWKNIETVALVRADGVIKFAAVQTYFRYYRIKISTSGTHKTNVGYGYIVQSL
jgi:hypothetical protein